LLWSLAFQFGFERVSGTLIEGESSATVTSTEDIETADIEKLWGWGATRSVGGWGVGE